MCLIKKIQCLTLTFLDTRQWASKHYKSLAHKDKPLVQNKARKIHLRKARELGTINLSLRQKSSADLLISRCFCLSPHKLHSTFFLQRITAMDMFSSSSVENFSSADRTSFFSSCCMTWSSCKHCKSAFGTSGVAEHFLEDKASKKLEICFILGVT